MKNGTVTPLDLTFTGTGTVTATGTPVDTTAGAKPVTVTITVTKGTAPKVDTEKLIRSGVKNATEAYWNQYQGRSFEYGDEWLIYAMVRSGKTLAESQITDYYASVAETVKGWSATQKPTDIEQAALALSLLGYDITNVEGVNLAAMIYNHPDMDAGSNELIYALLALATLKLDINKAGFGNEYRNLVSALYATVSENSKVSFDTLQVYQAF